MLPWSEIGVLDFPQEIAGFYCAQILAPQGTDLVKIEPPCDACGQSEVNT
ncbi:CoA transferase [Zwartia sp.]